MELEDFHVFLVQFRTCETSEGDIVEFGGEGPVTASTLDICFQRHAGAAEDTSRIQAEGCLGWLL